MAAMAAPAVSAAPWWAMAEQVATAELAQPAASAALAHLAPMRPTQALTVRLAAQEVLAAAVAWAVTAASVAKLSESVVQGPSALAGLVATEVRPAQAQTVVTVRMAMQRRLTEAMAAPEGSPVPWAQPVLAALAPQVARAVSRALPQPRAAVAVTAATVSRPQAREQWVAAEATAARAAPSAAAARAAMAAMGRPVGSARFRPASRRPFWGSVSRQQ